MTDSDRKRDRRRNATRAAMLDTVHEAGGLRPKVAADIAKQTHLPEAHIYGVSSFFHLLADPDHPVRVCQGLSCQLAGAHRVLEEAREAGWPATGCACLAQCDRPVAILMDRRIAPPMVPGDVARAGDWRALVLSRPGGEPDAAAEAPSAAGHGDGRLANRLDERPRYDGHAFRKAREMGPEALIDLIAASGLQGRGGAGFPAAVKWRAVAGQPEGRERYVVLNADEGEPGTFKDRDVLERRPDTVLEGLAIAAAAVGAKEVFCYLRGEFSEPWAALEDAIARTAREGLYPGVTFHMHAGHGAYICGEETALLEALEGNRPMPRLKPPYPTENGLWGQPTLVHNVETIACVPAIVTEGAEWFAELGETGPGSKLYCVSGHVARPGVYELPLGVHLDRLVEAAGGYVGELKAFSPGGASSGFLPAAERRRPLDFRSLKEVGSMLGSAGVVVLNETVDMVWATREQLAFFEAESCGQCAPCRIGTRFLREAVDRFLLARDAGDRPRAVVALAHLDEVAWQMDQGSICGLGQTAPLPFTSARRWFPEEFSL